MVHILICLLLQAFYVSISGGQGNLRDVRLKEKKETTESHIFMESIPHLDLRNDLSKKHRMDSDYMHTVVFVTTQNNSEELLRILQDVSDPASVNYGQHLSREDVTKMTVNTEAFDSVVKFVNSRGASVASKTLNGEYITCDAPLSVWEGMFNCEFFMFHQSDTDDAITQIVRAESYFIPRDLEPHVKSVFNTVQMPYRPSNHRVANLQDSSPYVTIDTLTSAYNLGTSTGSTSSTQGIYATIDQNFSPNDLSAFQLYYNLAVQAVSTSIGGHVSSQLCVTNPTSCVEANLDVQYIMATSTVSPTTFWYTDFSSFSSWLVEVADVINPPLVLSISYGMEEQYVTSAEFHAFNVQAVKLGAMGITIVVASGDSGAVSRFYDVETCVYAPSFPASSPYVTTVGATMGLESSKTEVACQSDKGGLITSGGGFSTHYSQPLFQKVAVATYFSTAAAAGQSPYTGYNTKGRGFPDVSLAGHNYNVFAGGRSYIVSGTSASAPVMAGFISNINAARMAVGKGSVGWVNPALYKNSSMFINDITSGDNKCADRISKNVVNCCSQGYTCTTGWDPVTGLGTVNYGKMESLFLSLGVVNKLYAAPSRSPVKVSSGKTVAPTVSVSGASTDTSSKSPLASPTGSPPTSPSAPSISPLVTLLGAPNRPPTTAPQKQPLPSLPIMSSSKNPTSLPSSLPSMPPSASPTPGLIQTSDSKSKFQCTNIVTMAAIMLTAGGMALV